MLVFNNGDLNYIFKIGAILVVSAFLSLTFGMLSGRFAAKASSGFAKNLRKGMFYNIQNYSFTNIDKFSTSSLVTKTYNRCNKCTNGISDDN